MGRRVRKSSKSTATQCPLMEWSDRAPALPATNWQGALKTRSTPFIHSPRGISLNLSDLGHVPATAIIAEPFPSALRDRDGVLEFDEPTLRMQDRGFDRDHHAALERQVVVGGRIEHQALAGQMRSLMTDEPHAVGEKVEMRQLLRASRGLFRRRIDVAAARPRANRLARRLLNGLDLAEQVLKLGVRLADTAHAAEIADIAVIIGAGVQRDDVAGTEQLVRWRTIETRARGNQAIFEVEAAVGFFPAQMRDDVVLGHARPARRECCLHRGADAFGRLLNQCEL